MATLPSLLSLLGQSDSSAVLNNSSQTFSPSHGRFLAVFRIHPLKISIAFAVEVCLNFATFNLVGFTSGRNDRAPARTRCELTATR